MSGGETFTTVALSTPGRLVPAAAASYERLRTGARAVGVSTGTLAANHAWRSYDDQVAIFRRYMTTSWAESNKIAAHARKWAGQTWYRRPGFPSCAVPGESNHGNGDTVDWQGLGGYGDSRWRRFAGIAADHGWNNTEGARINEPWHWTYVQGRDKHRGDAVPPAQDEPDNTTPEVIDMSHPRILKHPNGSIAVVLLDDGLVPHMRVFMNPNVPAAYVAAGQIEGPYIDLPDPLIWNTLEAEARGQGTYRVG